MRKIILSILGILLLIGAYSLSKYIIANKKRPKPKFNKIVKTVFIDTVQNKDIPILITASGNLTTSTNTGLSGGINLSWSLFNGGRTRTQVQNAKINLETQELLKQETELQINRDFNNAWDDYQNKLFVLQTQEKNVQTNADNFNRTEERFKLGQITSIEFRQAQLNLVNAINAKNAAKYEAKFAELQVLQLSGELLNINF